MSISQDSCSFYITKGLPTAPQVLVNGVLLDLEEEVSSIYVILAERMDL